ncbi:maleylpyruvate isomerase family mycothiol-dependent enzyme [Nocardia sp. NPDC004604]|uniref:maleylpyruvate isomerase family mycothiol-dependent enzyme n=1 Tax=Nocardia sp. NPDC004604 TaxID=3157013 RepID=UPI0033A9B5AA
MQFHDLSLDEQLRTARRGTAYFSQKLAELTNGEFDHDTPLRGWTRRHLIAHVGYNAAALCRLLDWAATGIETPMYSSADQRAAEIAEGATLNAGALRNLVSHTAARLDEKWRHLPAAAWSAKVRTAQGRVVPTSQTVWMRTREVWIHAVDLGNGAQFNDFPPVVLDGLLTDIVNAWRSREAGSDLILAVDNRAPIAICDQTSQQTTVSGSLAAIVRWAAGRGSIGIRINGPQATPPRWL